MSGLKTTGIKGNTYKALLRKQIKQAKPNVVGLAIAYVSVYGYEVVRTILDESGVSEVRLVTDTSDYITHPIALKKSINNGWRVRMVNSLSGTFHPKLYVGAERFDTTSGLKGLSLAIVGSPNISRNALLRNGECVVWYTNPSQHRAVAKAWNDCWQAGVNVTATRLARYEREFASRNRARAPQDMVTLGINDFPGEDGSRKNRVPPNRKNRAFSEAVASVAWAGLQSFTGDYTLQLEFPKEAGLVLQRIFENHAKGNVIDIVCADGESREFTFKYYDDNGMFRLNIPNSTPLVQWAREHKDGIGYLEYNEAANRIYAEILLPGERSSEIVERSMALGTWGRTPTRLYGWY